MHWDLLVPARGGICTMFGGLDGKRGANGRLRGHAVSGRNDGRGQRGAGAGARAVLACTQGQQDGERRWLKQRERLAGQAVFVVFVVFVLCLCLFVWAADAGMGRHSE